MKSILKTTAVAAGFAALVGCSDTSSNNTVDSADVLTGNMRAEFVTLSDGKEVDFVARLKRGSDSVKLSEGDVLQVVVDGKTHPLKAQSSPANSYGLTLKQAIGNEQVDYEFVPADKISEELSAIKLSELIEIEGPSNNGQGLNNPLVVSWVPAEKQGEKLTLLVTYSCNNSISTTTVSSSWKKVVSDINGQAEFDFTKVAALDEMEQCNIIVSAARSQLGTVDPEFAKESSNTAEQKAMVSNVELTIR